jgi:hypothetical protein
MGVQIVQRVISSVTDNRIQVGSGQFGRKVSLPGTWNRIRVGMRYDMVDGGSSLTGPAFYFGFGSGTANMIGDATTTNFIGLSIASSVYWARTAGTLAPFYRIGNSTAGEVVAVTKSGTTLTTVAAGFGANFSPGAGASTNTPDRIMMFVDISTGAPNYTVNLWGYSGVWDPPHYGFEVPTVSDFLGQMPVLVPTYNTHAAYGSIAIPFSQVAGTLDTVQFSWSDPNAMFEICDLAVAVIS